MEDQIIVLENIHNASIYVDSDYSTKPAILHVDGFRQNVNEMCLARPVLYCY